MSQLNEHENEHPAEKVSQDSTVMRSSSLWGALGWSLSYHPFPCRGPAPIGGCRAARGGASLASGQWQWQYLVCRSLVDLVVSVSPSISSLSACWGGWKEEEFPAHFLCELVCDHLRSDTLTSWSRLSSAPATSSSSRLCRTRKTKRINPKTHRTISHPVARSRRQLWSALPNWNSFGPLCARVPTMQKVVAVVNPPQHFGKSRSLIAYLQIHLGKRTTTYFLAFKNENRLQGGSDAEPVSVN